MDTVIVILFLLSFILPLILGISKKVKKKAAHVETIDIWKGLREVLSELDKDSDDKPQYETLAEGGEVSFEPIDFSEEGERSINPVALPVQESAAIMANQDIQAANQGTQISDNVIETEKKTIKIDPKNLIFYSELLKPKFDKEL